MSVASALAATPDSNQKVESEEGDELMQRKSAINLVGFEDRPGRLSNPVSQPRRETCL